MDLADVLRALIRRRQTSGGRIISLALTKAQLDQVVASVTPADYRLVTVSRDGVTSIDGATVWTMKVAVDPFAVTLHELREHQKAGRTGSK